MRTHEEGMLSPPTQYQHMATTTPCTPGGLTPNTSKKPRQAVHNAPMPQCPDVQYHGQCLLSAQACCRLTTPAPPLQLTPNSSRNARSSRSQPLRPSLQYRRYMQYKAVLQPVTQETACRTAAGVGDALHLVNAMLLLRLSKKTMQALPYPTTHEHVPSHAQASPSEGTTQAHQGAHSTHHLKTERKTNGLSLELG